MYMSCKPVADQCRLMPVREVEEDDDGWRGGEPERKNWTAEQRGARNRNKITEVAIVTIGCEVKVRKVLGTGKLARQPEIISDDDGGSDQKSSSKFKSPPFSCFFSASSAFLGSFLAVLAMTPAF